MLTDSPLPGKLALHDHSNYCEVIWRGASGCLDVNL